MGLAVGEHYRAPFLTNRSLSDVGQATACAPVISTSEPHMNTASSDAEK
jgi:hypothetical protein